MEAQPGSSEDRRPYRLHDLRHTATSRLFSASIPLIDVASWLGHADGGTLAIKVYGHSNPADLAHAAEALTWALPET